MPTKRTLLIPVQNPSICYQGGNFLSKAEKPTFYRPANDSDPASRYSIGGKSVETELGQTDDARRVATDLTAETSYTTMEFLPGIMRRLFPPSSSALLADPSFVAHQMLPQPFALPPLSLWK